MENRPAVPSLEELIAERESKKEVKDERKALRQQSEEEQRVDSKKIAAEKRKAKRVLWEQLTSRSG